MTFADNAFKQTAHKILNYGDSDLGSEVRPVWKDGTPAHTKSIFGVTTKYDLEKEFPITTLRKTNFKAAIDELLWIWQKKSNNVNDLNSKIWNAWADETGSIGKAYGYQLAQVSKYPEGEFDQVDKVLYDLKNNPSSRSIMTNIFKHEDLSEMGLRPCAYSMTFSVKNGKLNAILNQRSQDFLTANNWNVVQYAVLVHMFAQVSGLKPGILLHVISDCHIYDRHEEIVKELLKVKAQKAPKFVMNKNITNFYDFTIDDFELIDYKCNETKYKIEVAE